MKLGGSHLRGLGIRGPVGSVERVGSMAVDTNVKRAGEAGRSEIRVVDDDCRVWFSVSGASTGLD